MNVGISRAFVPTFPLLYFLVKVIILITGAFMVIIHINSNVLLIPGLLGATESEEPALVVYYSNSCDVMTVAEISIK